MSRPLPSLRTELLVAFALLAAAALVVAVVVALLVFELVGGEGSGVYLAALIVADVCVFVLFAGAMLNRLVAKPLREAIAAAEAIAAGDLSRRVPAGATQEISALSESFNRMTDTLLEERSQLIHAEKLASVGRLAAGLAHEIGNPLGAINGYAHIVRSRLRPQETTGDGIGVGEAIDGIERESGRIDRIVRGLLDYARPRRQSGGVIDAVRAVRATVRLLEDQGALRRTTIDINATDGAMLAAERFELEQLVVNLVLNAVDASGQGGRVTVHVRAVPRLELLAASPRRLTDPPTSASMQRPGANTRPRADRWLDSAPCTDVLQLIVADSGPGVPDADRDRIFDPFYTTKEPGKGTGLGLAIVARIVDNLGGTIWVQDGREGGAAFHVLLPASASVAVAGVPDMIPEGVRA